MSTDQSSALLRLPENIRERILSYLLASDPQEDFTTINYDLEWPHLQNPSSLTFTYFKADICLCPRGRSSESGGEHMYTRYNCEGPRVKVKPKSSPLWILERPNGPLTILRPATQTELARRPAANIARVNKQLYHESIPLLYRGRRFRFLTAPCPRGRYQAYATETILSRMGDIVLSHITHLSLICQDYEEDWHWKDAMGSYTSFCNFILKKLPSFQTLHLLVSSGYPSTLIHQFSTLFQRENVQIVVQMYPSGEKVIAKTADQFTKCYPTNPGHEEKAKGS